MQSLFTPLVCAKKGERVTTVWKGVVLLTHTCHAVRGAIRSIDCNRRNVVCSPAADRRSLPGTNGIDTWRRTGSRAFAWCCSRISLPSFVSHRNWPAVEPHAIIRATCFAWTSSSPMRAGQSRCAEHGARQ